MKTLILTLTLAIAASFAFGTSVTVTNSGNSFSPDTLVITYGDSVFFDLASAHNAIEVSQSTWIVNGNSPLTGGFQTSYGGGYVLPSQLAVGTYYYVCSPHASMGMKGVIIVNSCSTPSTPGTISGNTTVCNGSSNTYSITAVSGATTYTWNLPSGWSGTSNTNTIHATAGSSGGNITVSAGNSCGTSANSTLAVSINSVPNTPGSISGNTTICSGSANSYNISTVSGATSYSWTLPSGWSGTSSTNTINTTAGTTSGNVVVTANNSCGSSSGRTLAVTVNTPPNTAGTISGNPVICSGSSNTYSISTVSSATSYTWTLPSGWSGTSTTNSISTTSNTTSGNVVVTANNSCGSSAARTLAVTVNSAPNTPASISGNSVVCSGSSNTYSVASVNGASSYTWNLPSGWTGTSTTNSISLSAGSVSGNISVIANNVCGSSSAQTLAVTVNSIPNMPDSIRGNLNLCSGSPALYFVPATSGATSYTWTLPSGWKGSSTSDSISVLAGITSGNISVTANNNCGSSSGRAQAVTINSIPATPSAISGNTNICSGSSYTYSVIPVNRATSYSWTLPSGWAGTSTADSIFTTVNSTGGNISVTANNICGSSNPQTLSVKSSSGIPAFPGAISGDTIVCNLSLNSYSVLPVSGAMSYNWTLPNGWTGNSTNNTISVVSNINSGDVMVVAQNGCGSSTAGTLYVTIGGGTALPQPGIISGDSLVCSGSSNVYSVVPVIGAQSYTWTIPGGWSGTSATNSISVLAGSNNGQISVSANNACGASVPQTLALTVNTAPENPGMISGNSHICSSSSNTYRILPVNRASGYTWILPAGWSGTSTTDSVTAQSGMSGGDIIVNAYNVCGISAAETLTVVVNNPPVLSSGITGDSAVCSGSTNVYSISAINDPTSYTWTLPASWTGNSTSNSISATSGTKSGNITLVANNLCGSSAQATFNVISTTIDTSISQSGTTLTSNLAGATYQWINCSDNSPVSGETGQSFTAQTKGIYGLVITLNGCTGTSSCYSLNPVGIEEKNSAAELSIYPNPSNGKFRISFGKIKASEMLTVEIFNMQGKKVYEVMDSIPEIDLSKQPKGVYFLNIHIGNSVFNQKILIQ